MNWCAVCGKHAYFLMFVMRLVSRNPGTPRAVHDMMYAFRLRENVPFFECFPMFLSAFPMFVPSLSWQMIGF